jgi:hypothetical protein
VPADRPVADRLHADRLAEVLDVLSAASPKEAPAQPAGLIPQRPPVAEPALGEAAGPHAPSLPSTEDATSVTPAQTDLSSMIQDGGRHRRPSVTVAGVPAGDLQAQADLGPEVPDAGRHRRPGPPVPEVSAGPTSAQLVITPEAIRPATVTPADVAPAVIAATVVAPANVTPAVVALDMPAPAVTDGGRHRRLDRPASDSLSQPASGPDAPRHTRKWRGARTVPALVDSSSLTAPVTMPEGRVRSRQLALLGVLVLLVTVAVLLGVRGTGALSSAQPHPVATVTHYVTS